MHNQNYVDLDTSVQTQSFERFWVEISAWWLRTKENRTDMQSNLDAIAWFHTHREKLYTIDLFEAFIYAVKRVLTITIQNMFNKMVVVADLNF